MPDDEYASIRCAPVVLVSYEIPISELNMQAERRADNVVLVLVVVAGDHAGLGERTSMLHSSSRGQTNTFIRPSL